MRDVAVVGAGMTNFGKFLDRSMKDIAGEAIKGALDSAGIDKSKLEAAVVGNATAGLITGPGDDPRPGRPARHGHRRHPRDQHGERLRQLLDRLPRRLDVRRVGHVRRGARRRHGEALPRGQDALVQGDRRGGGRGVGAADAGGRKGGEGERRPRDNPAPEEGAGEKRSMFMDFYAAFARQHMQKYGTTKEQFARVAVKNH